MLNVLIASGSTRAHIVFTSPSPFTSKNEGIMPPEKYIVNMMYSVIGLLPLKSFRERGYAHSIVITSVTATYNTVRNIVNHNDLTNSPFSKIVLYASTVNPIGNSFTRPMTTASAFDTDTANRFINGNMHSKANTITVIDTVPLNITSPVFSLICLSPYIVLPQAFSRYPVAQHIRAHHQQKIYYRLYKPYRCPYAEPRVYHPYPVHKRTQYI